jgi:hypothetical protein
LRYFDIGVVFDPDEVYAVDVGHDVFDYGGGPVGVALGFCEYDIFRFEIDLSFECGFFSVGFCHHLSIFYLFWSSYQKLLENLHIFINTKHYNLAIPQGLVIKLNVNEIIKIVL